LFVFNELYFYCLYLVFFPCYNAHTPICTQTYIANFTHLITFLLWFTYWSFCINLLVLCLFQHLICTIFFLNFIYTLFIFPLLLCWVGVHCGIYTGSYNVSNISYLNILRPFCTGLKFLIHIHMILINV
jgi:hypothetical protein